MENQNVTSYRFALHALWELVDTKPAPTSPDFGEWSERIEAQMLANSITRHDLKNQFGWKRVMDILSEERQKYQESKS